MKIRSLAVIGTHTARHKEMVRFLTDVLKLKVEHKDDTFTTFRLPDNSKVEVFAAGHSHGNVGPVTSAPVPEFLVDDLVAARTELGSAGVELVGPLRQDGRGSSWQLFRAPDGNVYAVVSYAPSRSGAKP